MTQPCSRNVTAWCCTAKHMADITSLVQYQSSGQLKHFTLTSLANLFNQTPSHLLWETSTLQLMRKGCSYKYPLLIQLSKLEQCRVKKFAQGLTWQHRIRTCVLLVESPNLYPYIIDHRLSRVQSRPHPCTIGDICYIVPPKWLEHARRACKYSTRCTYRKSCITSHGY